MEFTYAEGKLESKMLQPPGAVSNSVSDQDPGGSVPIQLAAWIRIQQVKYSYKNLLFVQIFHDFHLFKINYRYYKKSICKRKYRLF